MASEKTSPERSALQEFLAALESAIAGAEPSEPTGIDARKAKELAND